MSREIYISSTPHETRLAIVEKDELAEIYYERENEYTLAGSIYNGRVTRVLPGMQSAFVDVGLERDAFLYITDFMEEQEDPSEFESSENRSSGRRERSRPRRDESTERPDGAEVTAGSDNGERGRRHRHDPGRRNEQRGPGEEEQQGFASRQEDEAGFEPPAAADAEEDTIAPEGSRRWRGRRGRRRGRNGEEASQTNGTSGSAPAEEEFSPADEDHAERPSTQSTRGEQSFAHQGRRDRNERRRDGGRERRPAYGADTDNESVDLSASAEPFILPGESLSKYRRDEESVSAETTTAAKPQGRTFVAPKPSTEVQPIAGWDGGLTLPGETFSRHRGSEAAPADDRYRERPASTGSGRDRRRERDLARGRQGREESGRTALQPGMRELTDAEAVLPAMTSQHEPEAAVLPLSDDAPAFELEMAEERAEVEEQASAAPLYEPQTDVAPPVTDATTVEVLEAVEEFHEVVAEYEPGEDASASYRVDPAGPSEFRQSSSVMEEEFIAGGPTEDHRNAETAAGHEFTTVQPTGEMLSEAPNVPEAEFAPQDAERPEAPIEHEAAVQSVPLDKAENAPMPPQAFAPGEGVLEEELLDDEDGELPALQASAFDDIEEETLESAADLGAMVEDISADKVTHHSAIDLDEDGFDIDEEEMHEDVIDTAAEVTEEAIGAEISEGEEEEFAEGEEFEDEESSDAVAEEAETSTPAPRQEGARHARRDGRRNRDNYRHDRRGMANSRSNGRPGRHSMQSTDLPAISDLLKPGQEVLVQIAKEPIAKKGARITSHIALPGRFLVFMPTVNHVGVSRKIESDGERRRLKEVLLSEKGEASGGFIVRTAAAGASEEELRSDLRFLLNLWADIKQRSEASKSPALIYHDLNLVERVLRDQVSDNFSAIWVDTETEYERVLRFLQRFQPGLIRRVKLYTKETPLFEQFGIQNEINKALRSKVWLKSGGSIVINQTEALVAIDINTGKYVGKTARLEDTIVKTNLDAIPEIVRQIRLRDLGGIIVIDFIDMDDRKNRHKVLAALEEELQKDRAPSKVLQFNDFGLVAITRKRVKQSLERTLSIPCATCQATGMVKSPVTVCNEIYVELRKMYKHLDKGDVMLRVNPEVVKQLKSNNGKWLQEMEEISGKTILVKSDPALHPEQFDIH